MLEVVSGGLLTTIQAAGRPHVGHLGVPEGGACDPWSLAVANLLLGNRIDAPALELTLLGPVLTVREPLAVGLAGADLGAVVRPSEGGERRVEPGTSIALQPGDELAFPGPAEGERGARAYLALPGGIDIPVVLGSASTCLAGGFGGLDGRALRAGDQLRPARAGGDAPVRRWAGPRAPGSVEEIETLRVLPIDGGNRDGGPTLPDALEEIVAEPWTVAAASNRMAVRLEGGRQRRRGEHGLASFGLPWGGIQLPPDGAPIVLLADRQTTGGYPLAGVVIAADRPVLGQLRPGRRVRLVRTTHADARAALVAQRAALDAGAAALG